MSPAPAGDGEGSAEGEPPPASSGALGAWFPDPVLAALQVATAFLAFWVAAFLVEIACLATS